jgi:hypothetical protein
VIGRWNVIEPLQEDEDWSQFDVEYAQESSDEGFEVDAEEGRMNANGFFRILGPQNMITASNSAGHYKFESLLV